jgi:hypothetical protein
VTPASALWLALVAVEAAAVVFAGRLVRLPSRNPAEQGDRDRLVTRPLGGYRPLLVLLAFALVDELAVEALHALVFEGAPRPFAGWVRVAYHVETAIVTAWPALLAAVCWRVFGPVDARLSATIRAANGRSVNQWLDVLLASWIGLVVGLAALYPLDPPGSGAPRTRAVLHAWEVLCVAVAWWVVWRGRARRWGRVEEALVIVAACETMVAFVGPWASDPFARWWIGRCFYLAAWCGIVGVLARPIRPAAS